MEKQPLSPVPILVRFQVLGYLAKVSLTTWFWFTGIGLETARDFAARGARVLLACRNMSKGTSACQSIMQSTGSKNLVVKKLDLSSMDSVQQFADSVLQGEPRCDIPVFTKKIEKNCNKKYVYTNF